MPWYEREDFSQLWALAHDRDEMPSDYDRWHSEATRVLNLHLAQGKALQVVTIRPQAYLQWLGSAPNTMSMRRTYVEYVAAGVMREVVVEAAE